MGALSRIPGAGLPLALVAAGAAALTVGAAELSSRGSTQAIEMLAIVVAAAVVYLVCTTEPVYVFTLAIVITPFAGNWPQLHLPGPAAPDRLLFVSGIAVVLFRSYVSGSLPRPRFGAAHVVMAAALLFAAVSAMRYHVLLQKGPGLLLVETFGILPFATFWLGPVIFPTARERSILLVALVAMAAYLGLTALFETAGLSQLVFPRYILNPDIGLQFGRARGPFVDAEANGVGLYVGAVAAAIATFQWQQVRWRVLAGLICALCVAGTIMTLERSIWISTAAATFAALQAGRTTRRIAIPAVAGMVIVSALAIFAVPGLRTHVTQRLHNPESIYDRQNLEQTALNMIAARPLLGFGWDQYQAAHWPYVRQSANIPLTATTTDLHSAYLTYGVELGLLGGTLWLFAVLIGVGGTALSRAPPELESWRIGLVAVLVFFLIAEAAVPPTVFVNASLWLLAGVVAVVRYPPVAPAPARIDPSAAGTRRERRRRTSVPVRRPTPGLIWLAAPSAACVLAASAAVILVTTSPAGRTGGPKTASSRPGHRVHSATLAGVAALARRHGGNDTVILAAIHAPVEYARAVAPRATDKHAATSSAAGSSGPAPVRRSQPAPEAKSPPGQTPSYSGGVSSSPPPLTGPSSTPPPTSPTVAGGSTGGPSGGSPTNPAGGSTASPQPSSSPPMSAGPA